MIKSTQKLIAELAAKLSEVPQLTTAVLYGSAAREELTETSDIDLLLIFDIPHSPETGGELEEAHRVLGELKTRRKIQLVATNLREPLDPDFLDNLCRDGIVVYGRPLVLSPEKLQLRPHVIYTYSVAGLSQVNKTRLQRALAGYRVVRKVGRKRYVSEKEGVLKTLHAKRIGKGVIVVPQENSKAIDELLAQHDVKHSKFKIWC